MPLRSIAECRRPLGVALAAAAFAATFCSVVRSATPAASDDGKAILAQVRLYHNELKDMTANFKVQHENNAALSKISSDFAQFVRYGFRSFHYFYKNPDKVRIESSATLFHFLHGVSVRNGDRKDFYVKSLGIHKTADVSGRQSNKKETALDFGVMAGDIWDNYDVWYQRSEHDAAGLVYVLGLKPKNEEHGGTMVVRLDAATLRVLERDRYNGDGEIQQRQLFSKYVHPLPHVWIPTVIKLYNNQGQFGGELDYEKVMVNTNLPDSLFH